MANSFDAMLKEGYRDEEGYLRRDLIKEEAEDIGKKLAGRKNQLSSSQLRNFFSEVRALEAMIEDENSFRENLHHILLLRAKTSYAYRDGNKDSKIPEYFHDFMVANIDFIEERGGYEDFEDFVQFFEAVVGYFYGHGGGKNR